MRLRPVDRLLLGYLGFVTAVVLLRRAGPAGETAWLLVLHGLIAGLILLGSRLEPEHRLGQALYDFYPLILLPPLYGELGILSAQLGHQVVLAHDRLVQQWEAALFGGQPAYEWIRRWPSVFWSGLLHLAYLAYYLILAGPLAVALARSRTAARRTIFAMMTAFVACYVVFVVFPVAGPYYTFPPPRGPVREVWSAQVVYALLGAGSSFGAAFPSSHVAASLATSLALRQEWPSLGWAALAATALLTVATVYCQMHYAVDAASGLVVGIASWALARRFGASAPPEPAPRNLRTVA